MIKLSYQELSLLLFALEGDDQLQTTGPQPPTCEEACPVIEKFKEIGSALTPKKQLARHLSDHLREGLIECGVFELMNTIGPDRAGTLSTQERLKLRQANKRLSKWCCQIRLSQADKQTLYDAISRLPYAAWFAMPRTLWRLRKKLKKGRFLLLA
jgi:hypothetical protein